MWNLESLLFTVKVIVTFLITLVVSQTIILFVGYWFTGLLNPFLYGFFGKLLYLIFTLSGIKGGINNAMSLIDGKTNEGDD